MRSLWSSRSLPLVRRRCSVEIVRTPHIPIDGALDRLPTPIVLDRSQGLEPDVAEGKEMSSSITARQSDPATKLTARRVLGGYPVQR